MTDIPPALGVSRPENVNKEDTAMNNTADIYLLLLELRKLEKAQLEELQAIRRELEKLNKK